MGLNLNNQQVAALESKFESIPPVPFPPSLPYPVHVILYSPESVLPHPNWDAPSICVT